MKQDLLGEAKTLGLLNKNNAKINPETTIEVIKQLLYSTGLSGFEIYNVDQNFWTNPDSHVGKNSYFEKFDREHFQSKNQNPDSQVVRMTQSFTEILF